MTIQRIRLQSVLLLFVLACGDDPQAPEERVFLEEAGGNGQTGPVDAPLLPFSVLAVDRQRQPMPGVKLYWETVAGGGRIHPGSATTAVDGIASAVLTPGPGYNHVVARAHNGEPFSVGFTAFGCPQPCREWTIVSRLPDKRAWAGSSVMGGRIWLLGGIRDSLRNGTTDVLILDLATGEMNLGEPLPVSRSGGVVTAFDGKIYHIGGYDTWAWSIQGLHSVLAFDPATSLWTRKSDLRQGRTHAAGAAIGGRIYIVGGAESCDVFDLWCAAPSSSLEVYDPAADRWTFGAPMKMGRVQAGAAVLDGLLVVAGGSDCPLPAWDQGSDFCGSLIATVEAYDPATDTWTSRAPLPLPGAASLAVSNGRLYALVSNSAEQLSAVYEYDPAEDTWRPVNVSSFRMGAIFTGIDDQLYVIGGENGRGGEADAEFYDAVLATQR